MPNEQQNNYLQEIKEDLEELITRCPELEELETELSKFNLFEVLGVAKKELTHSAFLRWLLDPKGSHGLGEYFLKKFLKGVALRNKGNPNLKISAVDIDVRDLSDCLVQAEEQFTLKGRRADISILDENSRDENSRLYVLIENKILSGEGEEQTKIYAKEAEKRYPNYRKLLIFLAPSDAEPESEKFISFDYGEVLSLLRDVIENKKDVMGGGPTLLIQQYVRNMEVNILEESDIEELCLKIYEKHKKAIDKIFECKPTNKQIYEELGQGVMKQLDDKEWEYRAVNSYCVIFKKEWRKVFNPDSKIPFFHYEFLDVGNENIRIDIHIEKFGQKDLRDDLKKYLVELKMQLKNVDLSRGQVVYKNVVTRNLYEDQELKIQKGITEMVALINKSKTIIEQAAENLQKDMQTP